MGFLIYARFFAETHNRVDGGGNRGGEIIKRATIEIGKIIDRAQSRNDHLHARFGRSPPLSILFIYNERDQPNNALRFLPFLRPTLKFAFQTKRRRDPLVYRPTPSSTLAFIAALAAR